MKKKKVLTLVLLSLVLALVGSIIIVSGMLDSNTDTSFTIMDENGGEETNSDILGFTSTREDEEDAPEITDEPEPETETKEELFDTFVPNEPTSAPQPTAAPTMVQTMPQAGFLDDYSKYFLILAPILIFGAFFL